MCYTHAMSRAVRLGVIAALLLVPSALLRCMVSVGCDSTCSNGLTINLAKATPWPSGAYVVSVTSRGQTATCTITLPATGSSATSQLRCANSTSSGTTINLDLDLTDAGDTGLSTIEVFDDPPELVVSISVDGTSLINQTIKPTYASAQTGNGNCNPCNQAYGTLGL